MNERLVSVTKGTIIFIMLLLTGFALINYFQEQNKNSDNFKDMNLSQKFKEALDSIKRVQIEIRNKYGNLYSTSSIKVDSVNFLWFERQLKQINFKIDKLAEQTIGIRQAINPTKPEEILTIARLKDAINMIELKQNKIEKDFEINLELFKNSVIRELNSNSNSTNWLFIILIPLILNLLYSMWKDLRSSKVKQSNATT